MQFRKVLSEGEIQSCYFVCLIEVCNTIPLLIANFHSQSKIHTNVYIHFVLWKVFQDNVAFNLCYEQLPLIEQLCICYAYCMLDLVLDPKKLRIQNPYFHIVFIPPPLCVTPLMQLFFVNHPQHACYLHMQFISTAHGN